MAGVVATPLDYYNSTTKNYYRRAFDISIYRIFTGTYKLSWTAMTRKIGSPSAFSFMVSVYDYNKANIYLNSKTYTFSSLGTQNFTETFVITDINIYN